MDTVQQNMGADLNDLNTRIRILEGKYNLTRERILMINQNMVDHYKSLNIEVKSVNEDLKEVKESIELLKNTMKDIINELKLFAKKEQVKILEKYINMWNPLNVVTEEEVIELIKKNQTKAN